MEVFNVGLQSEADKLPASSILYYTASKNKQPVCPDAQLTDGELSSGDWGFLGGIVRRNCTGAISGGNVWGIIVGGRVRIPVKDYIGLYV